MAQVATIPTLPTLPPPAGCTLHSLRSTAATMHSLLPYTRATARHMPPGIIAAWRPTRYSRLAKLPRVPAPHCILGRLSVTRPRTPAPPHPRTHAPTHPYTSIPPQSPHLSAPLHLCTSAQARGEALRVRAHRSLGSVARHVEPCPHEPCTKTHSSPNPNLSSNPYRNPHSLNPNSSLNLTITQPQSPTPTLTPQHDR